jgi:hypothetical protein
MFVFCASLFAEDQTKPEDSAFAHAQNEIINNARLVIESVEIVKVLLKRDLRSEYINLWDGKKDIPELLRIKKLYSQKTSTPNSWDVWQLWRLGDDFHGQDGLENLYDHENPLKDKQIIYVELVLARFEKICDQYRKIVIENKVEQRPFLVKSENIELYKLANLISKDPRASLKT